jgi:hypothetical protein
LKRKKERPRHDSGNGGGARSRLVAAALFVAACFHGLV